MVFSNLQTRVIPHVITKNSIQHARLRETSADRRKNHTNPDDDLDCNHFDNFLCDDFFMSSVTPEGLQGST